MTKYRNLVFSFERTWMTDTNREVYKKCKKNIKAVLVLARLLGAASFRFASGFHCCILVLYAETCL